MEKKIKQILEESIHIKQLMLKELLTQIEQTAQAFIKTYQQKGKVLIFGNGGSAADSQHIAAEFIGRFKKDRIGLPAIALTTNTSIITALANDYNYESIFEKQIEALAAKNDLALGISTSGKAKNVILGLKKARDLGLLCVGFTGENGKNLKELTDICLIIPAKDTARIQEAHITVGHIICEIVEDNLT